MNKRLKYVEDKISNWKKNLETFLRENDLFDDSFFHSYYEYFDCEPSSFPVVFVLTTEGSLWTGLNYGYSPTENCFNEYIEKQEFYYEIHSSCVLLFYLREDSEQELFVDYFKYLWGREILKENYSLLHNDLLKAIQSKKIEFHDFSPREFEYYINKLFNDLGYDTILGPGTNDKGIDIRIISNDTKNYILVQIKRYTDSNPIHLEAVKALCWDVYHEDKKAISGLFVTTSRYLPGVKKFSENKKIKLAGKSDIYNWNNEAIKRNNQILENVNGEVANFFLSYDYTKDVIEIKNSIFVETWGHNMVRNDFYLIIYEINNVSLIIKIDNEKFTDQFGQIGYERPKIPNDWKNHKIEFARRKDNDWLSVGEKFLIPWNGENMYFNYMD